jgi:hypothetical protein
MGSGKLNWYSEQPSVLKGLQCEVLPRWGALRLKGLQR